MRTPREEALASLKALQDKFQGASGGLPNDQVASMFKEFMAVAEKLAAPEPTRRMKFAGVGDLAHQRAEGIASLPREVQIEMDKCVIAATLLRKDVRSLKMWDRLMNGSAEFKKAMDSTTAGEGDEWVPTGLSPELVEEVTKMGFVESMHPHIAMPTQPYDVPIQTGRLVSYKASEQTADSGQTALSIASAAGVTNKLTLTASALAVMVLASKEVQEDSIVAILPFLRSEIIKALSRGVEEATINGDTTATHQDTDTHANGATDRRKLWKGYRKHALANSYSVDFAGAGRGWDWETFVAVRAKHGKYGINPADLYWLLSLQGFFKALSLKDAAGNPLVTTADKMPGATLLTGVLGAVGGSQIAVSEFSRDDLNASGVNGAVSADNIKTSILSVYKPGFVYGDRRDASIQLLTELYAAYQQDALLSVIRKDFQPLRPIATDAAVAIGYNIPLA